MKPYLVTLTVSVKVFAKDEESAQDSAQAAVQNLVPCAEISVEGSQEIDAGSELMKKRQWLIEGPADSHER